MIKVCAVTGASRGIGRATALELAGRGHRVFALARSSTGLEDLAREAHDSGHVIEPIELDVGDDESRRRAAGAILAATAYYGLDVLVNNAGFGQLGPLEEVSADKLRRQFEVNAIGPIALAQHFLPDMRARRCGWIVNVSSVAGRIATPFMGAYNGSKFALEGMSDALRLELAPFGVHVVLIEPGPIRTAFGEAAAPLNEERTDSPYARFTRRWRGAKDVSNRFSRSAEDVARVIARAVELNHPLPRYTITIQAKLGTFGRRVSPDVLTDWVLRRAGGLF
jgi:NAD(P)-dependent dehydrogenase (short-subunit alcohol dehydrogenase family)